MTDMNNPQDIVDIICNLYISQFGQASFDKFGRDYFSILAEDLEPNEIDEFINSTPQAVEILNNFVTVVDRSFYHIMHKLSNPIDDWNDLMDKMMEYYQHPSEASVDAMFDTFMDNVSYEGDESYELIYQVFVDQYQDWLNVNNF